MKGKLILIVGLGTGYVLGAAAGRRRYEQIKSKAGEVWNDPHVQKAVKDAESFVAEKTPVVQSALVDAAKAAPGKIKEAAAGLAKSAKADDGADSAEGATESVTES